MYHSNILDFSHPWWYIFVQFLSVDNISKRKQQHNKARCKHKSKQGKIESLLKVVDHFLLVDSAETEPKMQNKC